MRLKETAGMWMDRLFMGAVLAASPLFLFPRARHMWVGVVLGAMLIARGAIWGRFLEQTPLDWGIGALGLMILATCFVVPDIEFSLGKIAGAIYGILLYYAAVAVIRTERSIKAGVYAFILVGVTLAAFGVVGIMLSPEQAFAKLLPGVVKSLPKHNWALPGAEAGINPNAVGGSLLWVIPLALILAGSLLGKGKRVSTKAPDKGGTQEPGLMTDAKVVAVMEDARGVGREAEGTGGDASEGAKSDSRETQEGGLGSGAVRTREDSGSSRRIAPWPARLPGLLLLSLASMVFLAALFLSQSYGACIALILSVWLIGLSPKWKVRSLAGALVLYGALFGIGPLKKVFVPRTTTEVAAPGETTPPVSVFRVKIEQRYAFWTTGLGAIKRAPILGVGMNRLRLDPGINFENAHAHNQFITTGAELGIPGLVAYIAILMGAGWMAWVIWKRSKDRWMRAAAGGLIAGQLAFHIFGLGDAIALGSKTSALFWVSLALITAIYKKTQAKACGYNARKLKRVNCSRGL